MAAVKSRYSLVDEDLIERLKDESERKNWLILQPHSQFKGFWEVEAFAPSFFFDLKEIIGSYRVVSPASLDEFLSAADEAGYKVAFFEEPTEILANFEALNNPPEISLNSPLEGTINGLLPYQVQGFNFLKDLDGGVALWSTGTGKTALASALLKYHLDSFDLAVFVVKAHNKINVQRFLKRLAGIEGIILDGGKTQREKTFSTILDSQNPVLITNYEKFRTDKDEFKALFENQRLILIWDEAPTKLKNRNTQIYKAVCECLYKTSPPAVNWSKKRPKTLRQWVLSATPIENSPEDFFNVLRLCDPRIYGSVNQFRSEFVARYSFFSPSTPESWHNLDKMGLMAAHVVHQVDKSHPDIAAQFPKVLEEEYVIDWDNKDRRIYDLLTKKAIEIGIEDANILALITVMQMMCDAPSMVKNSAALRESFYQAMEDGSPATKEGSEIALKLVEAIGSDNLDDARHTKLDTLRTLLSEDHPNEKCLVFSSFNERLMPILEQKLSEWGISYVRYNGTSKERQAAQDEFSQNPDIQVFLSSDVGSDSLSLEQASVVIHYNQPWKWSTLIQRQNRIHRVVSNFNSVRYFRLQMADSVEDRKAEIIRKKLGYHKQVFEGAIEDQALSSRMTAQDLRYILTGE